MHRAVETTDSVPEIVVEGEGSSADSAPVDRKARIGVMMLCAAGIAMSLTQTLIMPLIPMLPMMLDTSAGNASWAVTVTMAVGAVATPIAGRLGDMYGKRRLLLLCIASVAAGSMVCAVSSSLPLFLVGRALQGLGVAFVSVGISVMREFLSAKRLGVAVGMMSSSMAVGGALGLPFAAFVAEAFGWRVLFWVGAAGSVVCFGGIYALVSPSRIRMGGRFDLIGALGLALVLLTLLLPVSKGLDWGWTSPVTLSLCGLSALAFAGWLAYERRRVNPLLDLGIASRRTVVLANIVGLTAAFAFYGMELAPIQMLMAPTSTPHGLGVSMLTAGLLMAPAGLVAFVSSNIGARMGASLGTRRTLVIAGCLLCVALLAMLIALAVKWEFPAVYLVAVTCFVGASVGISYAILPTLIMEATPVEQTGEANGLNALMRIIGLALSSAVVGMILANNLTPVPESALSVPSPSGYMWSTAIALAASVVTVIAALLLPRSGYTQTK
ncbi:MFS transporter [Rhodococcus globerulus]|uniref:MFS transporter n=1 Tax=Rhodococcus globerulus TaxID=33008 RepID=UPI003017BE25